MLPRVIFMLVPNILDVYKRQENGLEIVAAFDSDPAIIGSEIHGKKVFPAERITDLTSRLSVRIGIITVPAEEAQSVCDKLVEAGVLAIWNFAPVHLIVPCLLYTSYKEAVEWSWEEKQF